MPSMSRATLVTRIGQLTGDPSDTKYSTSQKQSEIDKAQEQFVLDTRCLKDVQSVTTVSGTSEYALPTDILDVLRVAHKGLKLESISKYELDILNNSDWTDDQGTPTKYYVDLDPNNKMLHLFPIPQAGDAGANLTVEYLKQPPSLSSDDALPFDGHTLLAAYNDAVAYWASSSLLNIQPDQQALIMAGSYDKKYSALVTECIEHFVSMGEQRPMNIYRGRNPANIGK